MRRIQLEKLQSGRCWSSSEGLHERFLREVFRQVVIAHDVKDAVKDGGRVPVHEFPIALLAALEGPGHQVLVGGAGEVGGGSHSFATLFGPLGFSGRLNQNEGKRLVGARSHCRTTGLNRPRTTGQVCRTFSSSRTRIGQERRIAAKPAHVSTASRTALAME